MAGIDKEKRALHDMLCDTRDAALDCTVYTGNRKERLTIYENE